MISPAQGPDSAQQSQQTDIHAAGGIRTRNPNKREAAEESLRPRGYWDRPDLALQNGTWRCVRIRTAAADDRAEC